MGITSHFALDVITYAMGNKWCDLCYGSVDTYRDLPKDNWEVPHVERDPNDC